MNIQLQLLVLPWVAGFCFVISTPLNAKPIEQNGTFIFGWEKVGSSTIERIPVAVLYGISWFVLYSCHDNGGRLCSHYFAHETIKSRGRRYHKHCQIQRLKTCNIDCIFCVDHYRRLLAARSTILRFISCRVNSTCLTSTFCPTSPSVSTFVHQSIYL